MFCVGVLGSGAKVSFRGHDPGHPYWPSSLRVLQAMWFDRLSLSLGFRGLGIVVKKRELWPSVRPGGVAASCKKGMRVWRKGLLGSCRAAWLCKEGNVIRFRV